MVMDTQPSRDRWKVDITEQRTESGMIMLEYAVRDVDAAEPFLLNNHVNVQIRTDHQRMAQDGSRRFIHESGALVAPADMEAFVNSDPRYHKWVTRNELRWTDDEGRQMAPFMYAAAIWAGGAMEQLDPQWVREEYTLAEQPQVDAAIQKYLDTAEGKNWTGDRRGTTLGPLQIGASGDDGDTDVIAFNDTGSTMRAGNDRFVGSDVPTNCWYRFVSVTGLSGEDIDSATLELDEFSSQGGTGIRTNVYAEDAAAPAAPSSNGNYNGKTPTDAFTVADGDPGGAGFHDVDVAAVVQELADSHDPSVIQFLHKDDASDTGDEHFRESETWDGGSAPKLTVIHSTPPSGSLPPIPHIQQPAMKHLIGR